MYIRGKIFFNILLFSMLIAFLHIIALKFYFYWTVSWYDIPMHILGGALISSITLWGIYFSPWRDLLINNQKKILYIAVVSTFVVGFLWEIFELWGGMIFFTKVDMVDSVKDLADDTVGALIAGCYFIRNLKNIKWLE